MNKISRTVISLFVLASAWTASALASTTSLVTAHPYQGITAITRIDVTSTSRTEKMHIVRIDLTAPGIHFMVTPAGGSLDTQRQTTLGFLNQQNAQVAVNAHFMVPFGTQTDQQLVGLAASNGNVYSGFEPQPVASGMADQSYAIIPCVAGLNIDANNNAAIVHRDPAYGDNKHVLESTTLYNAVSGSAQIVTNGVTTIPVYKDANNPNGLLTPNGTYSNNKSWYNAINARTAIGLTQDNKTLILFTVDKANGSGGMTVGEVADLLRNDYGVYNALNLDGGGSTTLAMRDPITGLGSIANASADNLLGRAVGSNLAVFALVPEPASMALLIAGGSALLLRRRN